MADEPNPAVAVTETPAGEGAGIPESTPAKEASTPATGSDWKEQAKGLSRDDLMTLLDEHPEGAAVKERLGQSHADKVLLKDRERIANEVRAESQREVQEKAWQEKWGNMSRAERADFLLQNQEMQEQHGRTIGAWWQEQSKTVKDAIPELKGKTIEEWQAVFEKHPQSWGQTMAALIEEVVGIRLAEELKTKVPKEAAIQAEAMLKGKVAKTLAAGETVDLRSNGGAPAGTDKDFVKAYANGDNNDHKAGWEWYQKAIK